MKILHTFQSTDMRYSTPEAAQLHIYHTLNGLLEAGHRVAFLGLMDREIIFTDDLRIFSYEDLPDSVFGQLSFSSNRMYKYFESGIRKIQSSFNLPYLGLFDSNRMYDACLMNIDGCELLHERYNLFALGTALASRRLHIPYVLEVNADLIAQQAYRGLPLKGIRKTFARLATHFCFNAAVKVICVSAELMEHLNRVWAVDMDKLDFLPCAADIHAFGADLNTDDMKEEFGLKDEAVVIWVGGFYEWHDLDLLLDAFKLVILDCPNTKLILVGDGYTRKRIEQKAQDEKLNHYLIFTGSMRHDQIPTMLTLADIAVSPSPALSPSEGGTGTPLKLFEYMAAGKPIVATVSSQSLPVITNGANGYLIEQRNVKAFADAIIILLKDPSKRKRFGSYNRQEAEKFYSWTSYTRKLEAIYRGVL
jgi:glycosyltransferase involved in cell wall biosynthesis